MALPQFTTEDLINNIKRRCSVPTSQLTYTNEDFTLLANDALQTEVVPVMMSTREEHFVEFVDISMPSTKIIPLPINTIGSKVRSVCYLQSGSPQRIVNVPRLDLDVVSGVNTAEFDTVTGFIVQGNNLVFYPNNSVSEGQTIRIYFYRRTLSLAAPNKYGKIVSIDSGTNTVVVDYFPSSWVAGVELNSVSSLPGFGTTNALATIVTASSPSLVLDTVEGMVVGDFISDYGYSAIPQVPLEAHAWLAQLTAVMCLEGLSDFQGMQVAEAKADKLKINLMTVVSQRVDGSTKKVINPSGGLRAASGLGRTGRGGSGF